MKTSYRKSDEMKEDFEASLEIDWDRISILLGHLKASSFQHIHLLQLQQTDFKLIPYLHDGL